MGRVIDLAWSPDERYIISASADKTSQIWEASSGRSVLTYRGHTDEVECVDWSSHGTYVASGIGAFGLAELARVAEAELRDGAPVNPERIDDLHVAVEELSAFISERLKAAA